MTKIKFILLTFFITISINCFSQKVDSLIDKFCNSDYKISYDKKDIPKSFISYYDHCQALYHIKSQFKKFNIVNPGETYNTFDFGNDLPGRRLIFTCKGISDNFYFIFFERGGSAVQNYLYLAKYSSNKINSFIALVVDDDLKTYAGLKSAILKKKYRIVK